jgi:hypothetical protein
VSAYGLAGFALMGCDLAGETLCDRIGISGALFVDVNVDLPCAGQQGPTELSGIKLTFTDATGIAHGSDITVPFR